MAIFPRIVFASFVLSLLPAVAVAESPATLSWCKSATVSGTLQKGTTQHPNGSKLAFHFIALKQPITIAAGECEGAKLERTTAKEIQVKEDPKLIGKFVGKAVTVSGELAAPENAYDVLPVILYPPIAIKSE